MQPDVITLSVDEQNNNGTPVNHVYSRWEGNLANRSSYIMSDHSLVARNLLGLYRTLPKVSGNFRGVAKTSVKFTWDRLVAGVDGVAQLTAPLIIESSFSVPVGVTHADLLKLRQCLVTLLDSDLIMDALSEQLMV